jgi:hypothetical protein
MQFCFEKHRSAPWDPKGMIPEVSGAVIYVFLIKHQIPFCWTREQLKFLQSFGKLPKSETFVYFKKNKSGIWLINKIIPFSIALAPETEEEEEDPLSFIQIKSAAQWMAVSKRISWNFEETETEEVVKEEPFAAAVVAAKGQEISEGNFIVVDFPKNQRKLFPFFFCTSLLKVVKSKNKHFIYVHNPELMCLFWFDHFLEASAEIRKKSVFLEN